jgi:hypothetical protein
MASEQADFAGLDWQQYSTHPSFTLSAGNGTKTVYMRVRAHLPNGQSVISATVSDTIILQNPRLLSFSINNGAVNTISPTVNLAFTYEGQAGSFQVSENSGFTGATWRQISGSRALSLSAGSGVKTLYLRVGNGSPDHHDTSNALSDGITVLGTKKYTVDAWTARSAAILKGYTFSAKDDNATCTMFEQPNATLRMNTRHALGVTGPLGGGVGVGVGNATCEFTLFGGKRLAEFWKAESVEHFGLETTVTNNINTNNDSRDLEIRFKTTAGPGLQTGIWYDVYKIVLIGPEGQSWNDAFE